MTNDERYMLTHKGYSQIESVFPQIRICSNVHLANPWVEHIVFISDNPTMVIAHLDVNIINRTYSQACYEIYKFCEQLIISYSIPNNINNILKTQAHICVNCGASLKSDVHKCEYCGTEYW